MFGLLQGASRDTARQAALVYYSGSNTLSPDALRSPRRAVEQPRERRPPARRARRQRRLPGLDAISAPPVYGTTPQTADPTQPGSITLTGSINPNTVYVFIYELDSTPGNPSPRWSCPTCAAANGAAVRTDGHQRTVVDLKVRWHR